MRMLYIVQEKPQLALQQQHTQTSTERLQIAMDMNKTHGKEVGVAVEGVEFIRRRSRRVLVLLLFLCIVRAGIGLILCRAFTKLAFPWAKTVAKPVDKGRNALAHSSAVQPSRSHYHTLFWTYGEPTSFPSTRLDVAAKDVTLAAGGRSRDRSDAVDARDAAERAGVVKLWAGNSGLCMPNRQGDVGISCWGMVWARGEAERSWFVRRLPRRLAGEGSGWAGPAEGAPGMNTPVPVAASCGTSILGFHEVASAHRGARMVDELAGCACLFLRDPLRVFLLFPLPTSPCVTCWGIRTDGLSVGKRHPSSRTNNPYNSTAHA